jgi:hypothetical protein
MSTPQAHHHGVPNVCMPFFLDSESCVVDVSGNRHALARTVLQDRGVTSLNQNGGAFVTGDISLLSGPGLVVSYPEEQTFQFTNTGLRHLRTQDSEADDTVHAAGVDETHKTVAFQRSASMAIVEEGGGGSSDVVMQFDLQYEAGPGIQMEVVNAPPSNTTLVSNTGVVSLRALGDLGTPPMRTGILNITGTNGISVTSRLDIPSNSDVPYVAPVQLVTITAAPAEDPGVQGDNPPAYPLIPNDIVETVTFWGKTRQVTTLQSLDGVHTYPYTAVPLTTYAAGEQLPWNLTRPDYPTVAPFKEFGQDANWRERLYTHHKPITGTLWVRRLDNNQVVGAIGQTRVYRLGRLVHATFNFNQMYMIGDLASTDTLVRNTFLYIDTDALPAYLKPELDTELTTWGFGQPKPTETFKVYLKPWTLPDHDGFQLNNIPVFTGQYDLTFASVSINWNNGEEDEKPPFGEFMEGYTGHAFWHGNKIILSLIGNGFSGGGSVEHQFNYTTDDALAVLFKSTGRHMYAYVVTPLGDEWGVDHEYDGTRKSIWEYIDLGADNPQMCNNALSMTWLAGNY